MFLCCKLRGESICTFDTACISEQHTLFWLSNFNIIVSTSSFTLTSTSDLFSSRVDFSFSAESSSRADPALPSSRCYPRWLYCWYWVCGSQKRFLLSIEEAGCKPYLLNYVVSTKNLPRVENRESPPTLAGSGLAQARASRWACRGRDVTRFLCAALAQRPRAASHVRYGIDDSASIIYLSYNGIWVSYFFTFVCAVCV